MHQLVKNCTCIILFLLAACNSQRAKSENDFDKIREMVTGRTAAEVEQMLGAPDKKEAGPISEERWIWWNYTFLGGNDYPPEERGKVVHLEIIFEQVSQNVATRSNGYLEPRVLSPHAVSYVLPETN